MQATRRPIGNPAWLGLALVVGLPALAEAQLFPNRTITRQREACAAEPPFNTMVRRNYFGYYPTCWSKFPDGWACPCPNPELPNRTLAFQNQPRDPLPPMPPEGETDDTGVNDAAPADMKPADDAGLPAVPSGGRSPFNTETTPPDNAPKRNVPDASGPQSSRTRTPAPIDRSNANPATSSTDKPNTSLGLLDMPRINPPVASAPALDSNLNAGTMNLAPEAILASAEVPQTNLGPLPSAGPPTTTPNAIASDMSADPTLLNPNQTGADAAPAQAPQRKGILSGLFNGSKRRR